MITNSEGTTEFTEAMCGLAGDPEMHGSRIKGAVASKSVREWRASRSGETDFSEDWCAPDR